MAVKAIEYMETPKASLNITTNGTHDVTNYATAIVNAVKPEQAKIATPTTSQQVITPDDGYALSSVTVNAMPAGSYGTISATKGTVSNNSVSVIPQIAAGTAGYNAMSAASGSAVTVSASELVSGSINITTNGTHDVTNYASAVINAGKPEETFTATPKITSQTITPTEGSVFSSGTVGALYTEINTSAEMDAINIPANSGNLYKYTGETTSKYYKDGLYLCEPLGPLCFTAVTAGSTVGLTPTGSGSCNFSYSTDNVTWNTFTPGSTVVTLANIGDKIYLKGNNPNGLNDNYNYYTFSITGSVEASGDTMSLLDNGTGTITELYSKGYCFYRLFNGCTALITAPELPATSLQYSSNVYYQMFLNCTSLKTAPKLPATTLYYNCYEQMFRGCTSLTTIPKLSATQLYSNCYYYMFLDCTSLYVSDSPISGTAEHAWTIPTSETFISTSSQSDMFRYCLGTRSSDSLSGAQGANYTYYTQNEPL